MLTPGVVTVGCYPQGTTTVLYCTVLYCCVTVVGTVFELQHRAVLYGAVLLRCCAVALLCGAVLLRCCTVVLLYGAVLLSSVAAPSSSYNTGLIPSVVTLQW